MKYTYPIILLLIFSLSAHAGNDPCGATPLDPYSNLFNTFNNASNSDSGVTPPPYGGYSGPDTWLSFIMPSSGLVNLIIQEGGMSNPAIAIYDGLCTEPHLLYNVLDNNCNNNLSPTILIDDLIPGTEYFIRVWAQDGTADGDFSIYLSETLNPNPQFILHSDAIPSGDCIQLTSESNTQQGCAWFEIPVDFSQPFTHTMTANFGNKDFSGADGICLIYQTNGPDYCGASGGGIGAEGMPNSAIFEFDTYQNLEKGDLFDDHTSFNINGDMNHTNSINGPVNLGNIEDGVDHDITFTWDGAGNYELYFDGILTLSGSYDFINNIFGGQTTAWWGYTASTGGSNNLHLICPDFEEIQLGTQEYQEIEICEGESFNGYSTTGFYIDYNGGSGDCLHQINTNLIVHEIPEINYIDTTICQGESLFIDWYSFDEEGEYFINIPSFHGCDSIIEVNLKVLEGDLDLNVEGELNCINNDVLITSSFSTNYPLIDTIYSWSGPNGFSSNNNWLVNEEGVYTLILEYSLDYLTCTIEDQITVNQNISYPVIPPIDDITLQCDEEDNPDFIDISSVSPSDDIEIVWNLDNVVIGNSLQQEILGAGNYFVAVIDTFNGCMSTSFFDIYSAQNAPSVSIIGNDLNCQNDTFNFTIDVDQDSLFYEWSLNGEFFSSDESPTISNPGNYQLTVKNEQGCTHSAFQNIEIDTLPPIITGIDQIIPCDSIYTLLQTVFDSTYLYLWIDPMGSEFSSSIISASDQGTYELIVIDTTNFCKSKTTLFVEKKGNSPTVLIENDTITCENSGFELSTNADQQNLSYSWYLDTIFFSDDVNPYITENGKYYLICKNQNGCIYNDSIEIEIDTIAPTINFNSIDTLDCDQRQIDILFDSENGDQFQWTTPSLLSLNQKSISTSEEGLHYIQIINGQNGCKTLDSIYVYSLIQESIFSLSSDTLTCSDTNIPIPLDITSSYEYLYWLSPSGDTLKVTTPIITDPGAYQLHIEVEGNCDVDTSVFIFQNIASPIFNLKGHDITCDSTEVTLSSEPLSGLSTYYWETPSIDIVNNLNIEVSIPGTYYFHSTGLNGCKKVDSLLVQEFTKPPVATISSYDTLTCDLLKTTIYASTLEDSIDFIWNLPNSNLKFEDSIQVDIPGNYILEARNPYGCMSVYPFIVIADQDTAVVELSGSDITCLDTLIKLSVQTNKDDIESLTWTKPDGVIYNEFQITTNTPGNYQVEVINQNGCSSIAEIFINEHLEAPQIELFSNDTLTLEREFINDFWDLEYVHESDVRYSWTPNIGLDCFDCPYPNILTNFEEKYLLQITDDFGCSDDIQLYIREKEKPVQIHIPNIISTNNDGINDGFTFYGPSDRIVDIEDLFIYDRWGNLVFHGKNLPINDPKMGWNGNLNNQNVASGVYAYYGRVRLLDGQSLDLYGDITVIR